MLRDIYKETEEFITKNFLLKRDDSILLCMSAGKDSILLFDIFNNYLKEIYNLKLSIFHLNHLTRGKDSDGDEKYIIQLAENHGLDCFNYRHDFSHYTSGSFEEIARNVRYGYIENILREKNITRAATAHTASDNVETAMMRIFKGTSLRGLQSIKPMRDDIIRPILFIKSEEVYSHLRDKKLTWREDKSNNNMVYTRNYVRKIIAPQVEKRFPSYDDSILSLIENASDTMELLDYLVDKNSTFHIEDNESEIKVRINSELYNRSMFFYLISRIISNKYHYKITKSILTEIYKKFLVNKTNLILYENPEFTIEKRVDQGNNIIVFKKYVENAETIDEWQLDLNLNFKKNNTFFIQEVGYNIKLEWVDYSYFNHHSDKKEIIFLSLSPECNSIIIRNRRRGDRILLSEKYKKIKKMLIDLKLNIFQKCKVPVFEINGEISSIGFNFIDKNNYNRVSKNFYVTNNSKKILAISKVEQ